MLGKKELFRIEREKCYIKSKGGVTELKKGDVKA